MIEPWRQVLSHKEDEGEGGGLPPSLYAGGCKSWVPSNRSLHPERRPNHWYDCSITEARRVLVALLVRVDNLAESFPRESKDVR